jgi:thiol-disulfide isomerase/thioredoxin
MTPRRSPVAAAACVLVALATSVSAGGDEQKRITGRRLPALNVGTLIQGDPADVGTWGDGKVYVVDLWGTWCSPCIANIPTLTRLQATYKDRGLVVIGYSWEKPEILRPFVKKMGDRMRYAVVSDPEEITLQRLTELEAVQSFPYAFLVDRQGIVVWEGHPEDNDLPGALARFFAER